MAACAIINAASTDSRAAFNWYRRNFYQEYVNILLISAASTHRQRVMNLWQVLQLNVNKDERDISKEKGNLQNKIIWFTCWSRWCGLPGTVCVNLISVSYVACHSVEWYTVPTNYTVYHILHIIKLSLLRNERDGQTYCFGFGYMKVQ